MKATAHPATTTSVATHMLYSYGAVVVAVGVGVVAPAAATAVLGPVLLLALVVLGLAHGACDQFVVPAYYPVRGKAWWLYLVRFLVSYLALAAVVVVGWLQWPSVAVLFFFLLTIWHWGSADAPTQPQRPVLWAMHSILRGTLLFVIPAFAWPTETLHIINSLLYFTGGQLVPIALFERLAQGAGWCVLLGHLGLWVGYARLGNAHRWHVDALEVLLLTGLFVVLPPLLALGVYFCFWHSLQHVLRLNPLLGYTAPANDRRAQGWALLREIGFFVRRSLPVLLISLMALAALYGLFAARLSTPDTLVSLALVVASVVTLPHALLVSLVMDRRGQ
ncbi:Brp/Blh family beta-carotene 15,15'-dioxygenase [Hymenobacter aerilatus]|uniref:Probable beta-carotene 15,15'-dioxygenase n=1 Tax=Hymenobacter aerilatus TaxID=2932251 RepID=A0A8T9SWL1_9BACT|nr:Brp/Blh family beta-carotene 15,15'-dioxygenase [Hymenobacter aerilatus]UOR06612.1 Brp/Blh family beta-carotene 15,15'-dioxygenase [Hymenobacter aerilatus]